METHATPVLRGLSRASAASHRTDPGLPWRFVRRAVYRPAFDTQTSLDLASVVPGRVTDLDVMHPADGADGGGWTLTPDSFEITGGDEDAGRWMYSFNPYACHELCPAEVPAGAAVRWTVRSAPEALALRVTFSRQEGRAWTLSVGGEAGGAPFPGASAVWYSPADEPPSRLLLQGQGRGMTLYCQSGNRLPEVVLAVDFPESFDFRKASLGASAQVLVGAITPGGAPVRLRSVRQFFSAGTGLADLRSVTTPDGAPLIERNRVFVTASLRGRGLPHPLQGVLSFDPALCDLRLEGVIVFDCGDGLWRNEIASHLIHDPATGEWLGLATGFSGFADTPRTEKQIRAFRTRRDPRFGFSVVRAVPTGLVGDYEDPSLIHDAELGRWRLALCVNDGEGYRAAMFEAMRPEGPFCKIHGPAGPDATGMQIVASGSSRWVLFGSADRCLYVSLYPDLKPEGSLALDLPPWSEATGTRVWPAVIPLPEGAVAPAVLVTMDRVNYPGMPSPNWTYGAVYFYHAVPPGAGGQRE